MMSHPAIVGMGSDLRLRQGEDRLMLETDSNIVPLEKNVNTVIRFAFLSRRPGLIDEGIGDPGRASERCAHTSEG